MAKGVRINTEEQNALKNIRNQTRTFSDRVDKILTKLEARAAARNPKMKPTALPTKQPRTRAKRKAA